MFCILNILLIIPFLKSCHAFARSGTHWQDFLKFDGQTPSFDVIEKTKQYVSEPGYVKFRLKDIPNEYYDDRYVFRGPVVGPINRLDLVETNSVFGLSSSFPDLERKPFGFCTDPENPFRALYFERWTATHTGDLKLVNTPLTFAATRQESRSPAFPFSIVWTPQGKIIYEHLSIAVDRFEGNTMGKVAVFGLFETAGLSIDNGIGAPFRYLQKINRSLNLPGQTHSRDEDIPSWWKSVSRGADPNDM